MKIFKEINQKIKDEPEVEFKGIYNREEMDEEDLKELGKWSPEGEGEFSIELKSGNYRIIIESQNTR